MSNLIPGTVVVINALRNACGMEIPEDEPTARDYMNLNGVGIGQLAYVVDPSHFETNLEATEPFALLVGLDDWMEPEDRVFSTGPANFSESVLTVYYGELTEDQDRAREALDRLFALADARRQVH